MSRSWRKTTSSTWWIGCCRSAASCPDSFDQGPELVGGLIDGGLLGVGETGDLTAAVKAASIAVGFSRYGTSLDIVIVVSPVQYFLQLPKETGAEHPGDWSRESVGTER